MWWQYRCEVFTNKIALFIGLISLMYFVGIFYSSASLSWRLASFRKQSELICILFLIPIIPFNRDFLFKVMKAFVFGGVFVAFVAWVGELGWLPNIKQLQHPAPYYLFFKIYGALFMAFAAYLSLILIKINWKTKYRFLWMLLFVIISYNVLWQSISRTGYIIYSLLMLWFFIANGKTRKQKIFLTCLTLLFLGLTFILSSNFNQGLTSATVNGERAWTGNSSVSAATNDTNVNVEQKYKYLHTSTGVRFGYLLNTITLWKKSPVFGHGTGSYEYWSPVIKGINAGGEVATLQHPQSTPENTYYRFLAEHGFIGLLLLLGLWIWQLLVIKKMPDKYYRQLAYAFMLIMFTASMSQDLILDESPRLFYIFLTCLLYGPLVTNRMGALKRDK